MRKYINSLNQEWNIFKENNPQNKDISVNIEGKSAENINLLYMSLYAKNRQFKGNFTSLNTLKKQNKSLLSLAETIPYITYNFNSKTFCFKDDLEKIIPNIDLENISPYIEKIKQELIKVNISGFSQNQIKKDIFNFIELPIPHIAFSKKEIIANEYINNSTDIPLHLKNIPLTTISNNDTETILTDFFSKMYINGIASMEFLHNITFNNIIEIAHKSDKTAIQIKESINFSIKKSL